KTRLHGGFFYACKKVNSMPEKDPNLWSAMQDYAYLIAFAIFGGVTKFWRTRIFKEETLQLRSLKLWLEFVVEIATSAFVGVIAFYACQASGVSELWMACIVGIAGHEGARAIQFIYKLLERKGFQ
uniref:phage holin family protein n=1 Tax=Pleionea sediminis TaxID=2569479 RepID=UPI00197BC870